MSTCARFRKFRAFEIQSNIVYWRLWILSTQYQIDIQRASRFECSPLLDDHSRILTWTCKSGTQSMRYVPCLILSRSDPYSAAYCSFVWYGLHIRRFVWSLRNRWRNRVLWVLTSTWLPKEMRNFRYSAQRCIFRWLVFSTWLTSYVCHISPRPRTRLFSCTAPFIFFWLGMCILWYSSRCNKFPPRTKIHSI